MLVRFLNVGLIGKDNYVVTDKSSMQTNKAKVLHTTFSCIAVIIWNTVLCKSHEPSLLLYFLLEMGNGCIYTVCKAKQKNSNELESQ